jgi:hypothetical protein
MKDFVWPLTWMIEKKEGQQTGAGQGNAYRQQKQAFFQAAL